MQAFLPKARELGIETSETWISVSSAVQGFVLWALSSTMGGVVYSPEWY